MDITFVDNPWFWAWAIPAVILTGISKSGLGSGVGGYTVPMMAMAISPVQAAAIALPILCVIDLAALRAWWGKWDRRIMRVIVPGGLIGIALGGITFRYMSDNWIKVMIGCIALGYLGFNGLKLLGKAGAVRKPMGDKAGRFWSTVSAFTSTIAHAGGPPMAVYLLSQKLDKGLFVATSVIYFAMINYVKLIPYFWLGLFDARNLATSAALVPFGILGTVLGIWLHRNMSQKTFYVIVYGLLGLTGSKLLWDGIRGLMAAG